MRKKNNIQATTEVKKDNFFDRQSQARLPVYGKFKK